MDDVVAAVRAFNRFYTRRVGALNQRFLGTEFSLPEARVLFEIVHDSGLVAVDLQRSLGMDAGYLSRVLARFEARGWITREAGAEDARRRRIGVTAQGRAAFDVLDQRQRGEIDTMLAPLTTTQRLDLAAALGSARTLLDPHPSRDFVIRTFRPGDLALLASRQAILYREEYGWGVGLERNVLETVAAFLRGFKDGRDQGWIAEVAGAMAGSILLTDEGDGLSRLRLFYVEPMARGRGIGDALIRSCLGFARDAGYTSIMLWTHTVLTSARRMYAAHGFELTETAMHDEFGKPEMGAIWRLALS